MDWALAFTAMPGYHENTSVSVAQAAQAAEPVTYDYTYHPLPSAQRAGERRVRREKMGDREARGEGCGGVRKWEGEQRKKREGKDVCG